MKVFKIYLDARIKISFHRPWSSSSISASGLLLPHLYYIYLNTFLVSRLLCGVNSSSLCYLSSTLIQQQISASSTIFIFLLKFLLTKHGVYKIAYCLVILGYYKDLEVV